MRRGTKAAGIFAAWLLILFTIAAAVWAIAGDGALLASEMLRFAPPEETLLPEAEYAGTGQMIAAYLTGEEPEFQYVYTDGEGTGHTCFQPHEAAHMADCRGLIRLAGALRWIAGGAALVLAGLCLRTGRRRMDFAGGILAGLMIAAAAAAVLLAWAVIDFDGLFTLFHRLAFTNEGWLLNPRTDLLIRLMPTQFFTALGLRVLITAAAAAAAAGIAAWVYRRGMIIRKEQKPA